MPASPPPPARTRPPRATPIALRGPVATALASGRIQELRAGGLAQAVAPVAVAGRPWGVVLVDGAATRVGRHAGERLAPFADLVSLAAATHEARTHLASLAGTDPLTGLGNRRTFDGLLEVEAGRAGRHGDPLSLVLLDIDHFKSVNDRFGHQLGDRVLIEVGRRLVQIARRGEAISRIGGEEFAWILPRTDGAGTTAAATRALHAISDAPFEAVGTLTISAGVCELATAGSPEEMVRLADRMLYRAKDEGRNTVRCFTPDGELAGTGRRARLQQGAALEVGGAEAAGRGQDLEGADRGLPELRARQPAALDHGLRGGQRRHVGAVAGHDVPGVGQVEDAGALGHGLRHQPVRVAQRRPSARGGRAPTRSARA